MKKRIVNLILLVIMGFSAAAQEFTHNIALPAVDTTGYYNVYLPVTIYPLCRRGYQDIRLFETGKKQQLPYILKLSNENGVPKKSIGQELPFEIISQNPHTIEIELPAYAKPHNGNTTFYCSPDNSFASEMTVSYKDADDEGDYQTVRFDILGEATSFFINSYLLGHRKKIRVKITHSGGRNFKLDKVVSHTYVEDLSYYHAIEGVSTEL